MGNTTSMKEAEGSEGAYHTRRRGRGHKRSGHGHKHKHSVHKRSMSGHKHKHSGHMSDDMHSGHMQTKKVHFRRRRKSRRQRGGHAPAPLSPMALA